MTADELDKLIDVAERLQGISKAVDYPHGNELEECASSVLGVTMVELDRQKKQATVDILRKVIALL